MKIGGDSLNTTTWSQLIQVPCLLLPYIQVSWFEMLTTFLLCL